jgi:hypothetical protein
MELNYTEIGARLKIIRGALSQAAFGEPIGYGYGYVKNCEHGKKPSLEYIHKIVEHYGASISWIIYGIEPIYSDNKSNRKELPFDSDLAQMTLTLKRLIESDDPDIRGWTKIQFKRTFTDI